MYQFYLLSVLTLVVGGLVLARRDVDAAVDRVLNRDLLEQSGFVFGLGIAAVLAGVLRLLSVTEGDVPVVGDLLPALSGVVLGASLLTMAYEERPQHVDSPFLSTMNRVLLQPRRVTGTAFAIIGGVHFLIPGVLIL